LKAYKMKVADDDSTWWEEPRLLQKVESLQEAQEIAAKIVAQFNRTLRPGELPRRLLIVKESNREREMRELQTRLDEQSEQ